MSDSKWLKRFENASRMQNGRDLRRLRVEIQESTMMAVACGNYLCGEEQVNLPHEKMEQSIKGTHVFIEAKSTGEANDAAGPGPRFGKTKVEVKDQDCLLAARELWEKERDSKIAVLNMANSRKPGGGWEDGAGAQEENLHRRSNLFQHLSQVTYPLPLYGGVFSPDVYVFRGSEATGYPFLEEPWPISVLSLAAYNNPQKKRKRDGTETLTDEYAKGTRRKIMSMLCEAKKQKVKNLVLSALGCGAFGNPPSHMAMIFADCLADSKVRDAFDNVVFAIIEDHNSPSGGNFQPFKKVFEEL